MNEKKNSGGRVVVQTLLALAKIICISVAGMMVFAYSTLGLAAFLFGFGPENGLDDVRMVYCMFAFPTFLIVFLSLRWGVAAMWLYLIGAWMSYFGLSLSAWHSQMFDFPHIAFVAFVPALLVTLAYIISGLGGEFPSLEELEAQRIRPGKYAP